MPDAQPNVIAVVTADWHLAEGAWARHPGLQGDALWALAHVAQAARNLGVPILAAGDLYDDPYPPSWVVLEMCQHLGPSAEKPAPKIFYILGQKTHDGDRLSWVHLLPNTNHIDREIVRVGNYNVLGLDICRTTEEIVEVASCGRPFDVLLTHQVWQDFNGRAGGPKLSDLPTGMTVITGDYHRSLVREFTAADGTSGVALSPGPLAMQSVDEPPDKYYWLLRDDLSVEAVRLPNRPFANVEIETEDGLDQFLDEFWPTLRAAGTDLDVRIAKPLLRIKLSPDVVGAAARIESVLSGNAFYHTEPMPRMARTTILAEAVDPTPYGVDLSEAGFPPDSRTGRDAVRLLNAVSRGATPAEELAALQAEHYSEIP